MSIPHLAEDKSGKYFVVHDKPFLPLGGELHNSSGSDLRYMEEAAWPAIRRLGGNFYLIPAYWEYVEPEEGVYNFDLVDGIIDQARREGVKLGLLWLGTWKNGVSDYIPQWLKRDHSRYFLARDENGVPLKAISPLCTAVRDLDSRAFAALMRHLKSYDEDESTVIMVQVENEVGIWMHDRDFCRQSTEAYMMSIPDEVSKVFAVTGTWEQAFGRQACQQFEAYHYAKFLETVASAGRKEYDIPLFVNCVPSGGGFCPAGGPDSTVHKMWMAFAPSIDIYSPDIYAPYYKDICRAFVHNGNPLFIPETNADKDSAAKLIYAVGGLNCIGFAPFGCEDFFGGQEYIPDIDWASNGFPQNYVPEAGDRLRIAYQLVWALWPEIRRAHGEGKIHAFYQQDRPIDRLEIQKYRVTVSYGKSRGGFAEMRDYVRDPSEPPGAGAIIERGDGEFLVFGTNFSLEFGPACGGTDAVFVTDKYEVRLDDGVLNKGRSLNGDERNITGIGVTPAVISIKLDKFH